MPPPAPVNYADGDCDGELTKVDGKDNVYLSTDCVGFRQVVDSLDGITKAARTGFIDASPAPIFPDEPLEED